MLQFAVSVRHYLWLRRVSLLLAIGLVCGIFWMADSSLATGALRFEPPLDKILHAGVYGIIAALIWFSGAVGRVQFVWLLVTGVGLLAELHQRGIPGREASAYDLLADMSGIALALWLAGVLRRHMVVTPADQR